MLPDGSGPSGPGLDSGSSQCTYRCVVLPDDDSEKGLVLFIMSQCTYRCVVLPDALDAITAIPDEVSMHLQVRGAP